MTLLRSGSHASTAAHQDVLYAAVGDDSRRLLVCELHGVAEEAAVKLAPAGSYQAGGAQSY